MTGKISIKHFVVFALIAVFASFFIFTGCEKEVEKIVTQVVHDTTRIDVILITVTGINANPDSIAQGGSIMLTATITKDPRVGTLALTWSAEAGQLNVTAGDTVTWKAPDDAGAYKVRVTASDGVYAGTGERTIGVGMYAPTADPYYVGGMGAGCGCHSSTVTSWALTAHSHAWATLQESGHPASYCNPCHAVGWDYDSTQTPPYPIGNTGNSGYDEAPIAKFENVQCENCHGPASGHPSAGAVSVSYEVDNCSRCHDGTHHPFLAEWLVSPHNFDRYAHTSASCGGCHDGVASAIRLDGGALSYPLTTFYGSGSIAQRPPSTEVDYQNVVCQTCHDPHSDANPGQLRAVADVPLVTASGESPIITEGGVGKLCMHCHHARRGPDDQVPSGRSHFGPHSSPQGDMSIAKTGYPAVAPTGFNWAGPSHLLIENSCTTCHMHTKEYVSASEPAVTGHSFEPTVEACARCHGVINDFGDIPAADDFDADGTIEGLQHEVEGLLELLVEALVADGLDTLTYGGIEGALSSDTSSTFLQREVGWNLVFVESDGSHGIHNPDYAIQLLQQSYLYLTGSLPGNAAMIQGNRKAVRNW